MQLIRIAALILCFVCPAFSQYAYRIRPVPTLPAACNPLNGEIIFLINGSVGNYECAATNTWRKVSAWYASTDTNFSILRIDPTNGNVGIRRSGPSPLTVLNLGSNDLNIADRTAAAGSTYGIYSGINHRMTGNMTAHIAHVIHPISTSNGVAHTVTDQIGLVVEAGEKDAASIVTNAYGLYLSAPTIGAAQNISMYSAGNAIFAAPVFTGTTVGAPGFGLAAGELDYTAGGNYYSGFKMLTSATAGLYIKPTGLILGSAAVTSPKVAVSAAVAGQTQGIIILKGDDTAAVFADLGAAANGSMIYCSNCNIANPCTGGGTGAIAKRLNGVWVCN